MPPGPADTPPAVVVLAGEDVDGLVGALTVNEHQRRGVDEGQVDPDHLLTGRHGEVGARRLAVEHEEGDVGRARRVGQGTDAVRACVVLKEHRRAGRHGVVHVAGDRQGVVHAALDLERPVGAVDASTATAGDSTVSSGAKQPERGVISMRTTSMSARRSMPRW